MATTIYFRDKTTDVPGVGERFSTGQQFAQLIGPGTLSSWRIMYLSTSRGSVSIACSTATVAGTTLGVEVSSTAGALRVYISPPLSADVTISGSITFNLRASESAAQANTAINCRVLKLSATDSTLLEILKTARTTELGTSEAAENFAATPTSTAFKRGDRIVLSPFGDDAGTMGSGRTFGFWTSGPTAAASGDSYATFTETFSFESAPAGTTVYPSTSSAGVNPGAATELEAWTSRGGGVTTAITNTVAGPTNAIQITDTAGGTALEWYTRQLQAVTLAGAIEVHVRGLESGATAHVTVRCEIAICAADGTGATVWGIGGAGPDTTSNSYVALTVSEADAAFWVGGPSTSITDGQRIRIRILIDDVYGTFSATTQQMATGFTATVYYAGTSGGASGDSYLTFPVTLTEYSAAAADDRFPYVGGGYYP